VKQDGPATEPISGSAFRSIINPKANFIFTPFSDNTIARGTNLFLNYGGGFHSNDARVVVQNPAKALARYWGGELGSGADCWTKLISARPTGNHTCQAN
jgi:hypothetical protein